jgi:hypothetical protein
VSLGRFFIGFFLVFLALVVSWVVEVCANAGAATPKPIAPIANNAINFFIILRF